MSPLVDQKHFSNVVRQRALPEHSDTSTEDFKSSGSKNNNDVSQLLENYPD